MAQTPGERTLASECRAVESGHRARLSPDRTHFVVKSDSEPGVDRRVRVTEVAGIVVFECDCPYGAHQGRHTVPCLHGSTAARRLEREGLLRWSAGRWEATPKAERLAPRHDTTVLSGAEGARSNFEVRCSCGWTLAVATLRRETAEAEADRHARTADPTVDDVFAGLS